jgi:hypothetical protein
MELPVEEIIIHPHDGGICPNKKERVEDFQLFLG